MSNLGSPCKKKLHYEYHHAEKGEPIGPEPLLNFLYGDVIELLYLMLARAAGHKVEGEQDVLKIGELEGSRDCVIDGVTVDVKSANGRSYSKFDKGELEGDDPFGYITQLQCYLEGGKDDPLVKDKDRAAFFAINKERGGCCLLWITKDRFTNWERTATATIDTVVRAGPDTPPDRGLEDVPEGKSGNRKLAVTCSYCAFKEDCWDYRTFLYARGPVFLTKVEQTPKVPEAT
jgi:hypothetical protein